MAGPKKKKAKKTSTKKKKATAKKSVKRKANPKKASPVKKALAAKMAVKKKPAVKKPHPAAKPSPPRPAPRAAAVTVRAEVRVTERDWATGSGIWFRVADGIEHAVVRKGDGSGAVVVFTDAGDEVVVSLANLYETALEAKAAGRPW